LQIGAVLVAALGGYVYCAQDVLDPIILYLARGDIEYTTSLSNRLPLWDVFLAELEKHPWTGAGFAAFWSPENCAWLELIIVRSAVSAHNGYLEELLNITNSLVQDFLQFPLMLILTFLDTITSKSAMQQTSSPPGGPRSRYAASRQSLPTGHTKGPFVVRYSGGQMARTGSADRSFGSVRSRTGARSHHERQRVAEDICGDTFVQSGAEYIEATIKSERPACRDEAGSRRLLVIHPARTGRLESFIRE
jgi:hypothetical protein